jgi:hypothetical protein
MREQIRVHRQHYIQGVAHHVQERGVREEKADEPEVGLVQRHLAGEPGSPFGHDAELYDFAQVMIAQIIEVLAMIGHPQLRERLGVAKRTFEEARHKLGDLGR